MEVVGPRRPCNAQGKGAARPKCHAGKGKFKKGSPTTPGPHKRAAGQASRAATGRQARTAKPSPKAKPGPPGRAHRQAHGQARQAKPSPPSQGKGFPMMNRCVLGVSERVGNNYSDKEDPAAGSNWAKSRTRRPRCSRLSQTARALPRLRLSQIVTGRKGGWLETCAGTGKRSFQSVAKESLNKVSNKGFSTPQKNVSTRAQRAVKGGRPPRWTAEWAHLPNCRQNSSAQPENMAWNTARSVAAQLSRRVARLFG